MTRKDRLFLELCIQIARGEVGGKRFNELLLETGVVLDEMEWETANRLIGRSETVLNWVAEPLPPC